MTKEAAPAAPPSADALLAEGRTLYAMGRAEAALEPLQQAAGLAPGRADLLVALARAFLDAGKLEHAETAARRALETDRSSAGAHLVLGTLYQWRGRTAQALEQYRSFLALEPRGPEADEVRAILVSLQ